MEGLERDLDEKEIVEPTAPAVQLNVDHFGENVGPPVIPSIHPNNRHRMGNNHAASVLRDITNISLSTSRSDETTGISHFLLVPPT